MGCICCADEDVYKMTQILFQNKPKLETPEVRPEKDMILKDKTEFMKDKFKAEFFSVLRKNLVQQMMKEIRF